MKTVSLLCLLVMVCWGQAGSAWAATYHVSPGGDDDLNSGSQASPWRTIQKAAVTMAPGDTVIVADGDYDEVVTVSTSGTGESARLIFRAATMHGAGLKGFVITGDYVTIDGFDINADSSNWRGVFVNAADYVQVLNNYVHECPMGGIDVTYGASYAEVIGNVVHHNGQWGIELVGSYGLIEGNEISETVQHHPDGEEPGFSGHDADGLRIFGDHHIIRGNYIHDIANPSDPGNSTVSGEMPHSDCLQTWDAARPVMTDTLIEGNHCRVHHISGKGIIMSAVGGNTGHDITIRNNIFEYRDIGISVAEGTFERIYIYNNTFKNDLGEASWGCAIALENVTDYAIQNNISVDAYMHRELTGGSGVVSHNLVWNSDGSTLRANPGEQGDELWGVDPLFVLYDWVPGGSWDPLNYHLLEGSPAIDVGIALADVTDDFDGIARPQEAGFDLGAFEYVSGSCVVTTCAQQGYTCGEWPDGCGGTVSCGGCSGDAQCNASGQCVVDCGTDCVVDGGSTGDGTSSARAPGCGCTTTPESAPWLLFVFALGWWIRRRFRPRRAPLELSEADVPPAQARLVDGVAVDHHTG